MDSLTQCSMMHAQAWEWEQFNGCSSKLPAGKVRWTVRRQSDHYQMSAVGKGGAGGGGVEGVLFCLHVPTAPSQRCHEEAERTTRASPPLPAILTPPPGQWRGKQNTTWPIFTSSKGNKKLGGWSSRRTAALLRGRYVCPLLPSFLVIVSIC